MIERIICHILRLRKETSEQPVRMNSLIGSLLIGFVQWNVRGFQRKLHAISDVFLL